MLGRDFLFWHLNLLKVYMCTCLQLLLVNQAAYTPFTPHCVNGRVPSKSLCGAGRYPQGLQYFLPACMQALKRRRKQDDFKVEDEQ